MWCLPLHCLHYPLWCLPLHCLPVLSFLLAAQSLVVPLEWLGCVRASEVLSLICVAGLRTLVHFPAFFHACESNTCCTTFCPHSVVLVLPFQLICNCRPSPLAGSPLVPLSPYAAGPLLSQQRTPVIGPSAGAPVLEMTVPLAAASRRLEGLGGTVVRIYCSDLAEEHGNKPQQSLGQESPAASGRVSLGPDEAAAAAAQFAKAVAEGKAAAAAAAGGDCNPPAAAGGCSANKATAPVEPAAAAQAPDGSAPAAFAGDAGSAAGLAALVDPSAAAQAPGGAACAVMGRQSPAPAGPGSEGSAGQAPGCAPAELPAPSGVPEAPPEPLAVSEAQPAGPQAQARSGSPAASIAPGAAGTPQAVRSVSPVVAGRGASLGPVAGHLQAAAAAGKGAVSAVKADPDGVQATWPDSVPQQVEIPGRSAGGQLLLWCPPSPSLQSTSQPSAAVN